MISTWDLINGLFEVVGGLSDCHWINHHCQLCDKRWSEDQ